jgi:hypothetical protein
VAPNERLGLAFEAHLPVFIEIGIVGTGAGGRDRVEALKHKRDPGDKAIRRDRAPIDDYLLGTFARPEPGAPARKRSEHLLLAADRRRDTDQTFYRVFYLPQDTAERQAVEALVRGSSVITRPPPSSAWIPSSGRSGPTLRRLPEKNVPDCAGFSFVFKKR